MAARHTILITASELADELKARHLQCSSTVDLTCLIPEEGRAQYREGHIPSALYLHLNDDCPPLSSLDKQAVTHSLIYRLWAAARAIRHQ